MYVWTGVSNRRSWSVDRQTAAVPLQGSEMRSPVGFKESCDCGVKSCESNTIRKLLLKHLQEVMS